MQKTLDTNNRKVICLTSTERRQLLDAAISIVRLKRVIDKIADDLAITSLRDIHYSLDFRSFQDRQNKFFDEVWRIENSIIKLIKTF